MTCLKITLLGTFQVTQDNAPLEGFRSDKVRALLAYLAVESGRTHQRSALASLLWGDYPDSAARASLRSALSNLRRLLGPLHSSQKDPGCLLVSRRDVQFVAGHPNCWVDAVEFDALAAACQAHVHRDTLPCATCIRRMHRMVDLYGGDLLAGFTISANVAFEDWRILQQENRHGQIIEVLRTLIAYHSASKDYAQVVFYARRQVELAPWIEEGHRNLMWALARNGQSGAALAQYETCCRVLCDELGVEPGEDTTLLCYQIRSGALDWGKDSTVLPNPYKGLRAFQEDDANYFFGRKALVAQLVEKLTLGSRRDLDAPDDSEAWMHRFLAIVGPSGSGKSSLVRAGLIPVLRRVTQWHIATMVPGTDPLAEMLVALKVTLSTLSQLGETQPFPSLQSILQVHLGKDERLLLVVDQFEELFTRVPDEGARAHFLVVLLAALKATDSRLRVLLTLRADYYDQPLRDLELAQLFGRRTVVIPPLTPEELQCAIVGPAEWAGLQVEPALTATLVADAGREPGALPLLQYALTELFEHRESCTLSLSAYEMIGALTGALVRRVDALYAGLSPGERAIARQVFLYLIVPGQVTADGRTLPDARRRVSRAELTALAHQTPQALETVLELFSRYRLLTLDQDHVSGEPIVEIAHEALIAQWRRLRDWLHANREDMRQQQHLAILAAAWDDAGCEPSFLVRGKRLVYFEDWHAATTLTLTQVESAYLQASLDARQARKAELERRRRLESRRSEVLYSLSLATGAQLALNNRYSGLALALALEANRGADPPPQARRILAKAAYAPGVRRVFGGHTGPVEDIAITACGRHALSASADGSLILWDMQTGVALRRFVGHDGAVHSVALLPDDRQALSASSDAKLILWDLSTGEIRRCFHGHEDAVLSVALSPDGRTALSGSRDTTLILWDVASGGILRRFSDHEGAVACVAISPDGLTALSASADQSVIVWDLVTGEIIWRMSGYASTLAMLGDSQLQGHFDAVCGVCFTPDGQSAISVSQDEYVILWDLETGTLRDAMYQGVGLLSVTSGPYGSMVMGALDGQVFWVDMERKTTLLRLRGHTARVLAVALTSDGRGVLTGAGDGDLRLWDLQNGAEIRALVYPRAMISACSVDISPDGQRGLTTFFDSTISLWAVDSGEELGRLQGHTDMSFAGVLFLPDGRRVVSGSGDIFGPSKDNTVRVWDVETCQELQRFTGHTDRLWNIAVSSDGRFIASASHDGTLRVWDLALSADGTPTVEATQAGVANVLLDVSPQAVRSVTFSPDVNLLAVGLAKGRSSQPDYGVRLINLTTGQEVRRLVGHSEVVSSLVFSPDGQYLFSGGNDGSLVLWDVAGGVELWRFVGHASSVTALAFHPDGRLAASGSSDASVILWDTITGEALCCYTGHATVVLGVTFAPDGKTLFSAGDDFLNRMVREWRLDTMQEMLLDWIASNRHVPGLTEEQRARYHIVPVDKKDVAHAAWRSG